MHRSPRRSIHAVPPAAVAALLVALLAACAPAPSPPASVGPSAVPSGTPPAMPSAAPGADVPLPVVVDTDLGMDDLLALYILLRDPAVDVRAIAIDGTGLVHCGPGLRNVRRILAAFGREEIPFGCGRDDPGPDGVPFPDEWRAGADDMYGVVLPPVVGTEAPPPAATLLARVIDEAEAPVTVVALGTWTNLQDLAVSAPGTLEATAGIHAMAGAIDVPGNMTVGGITPADGVEWNVGADPDAVAAVLALDVPVTLVPLDATDDVPVPADILARLEADHAAAGADLAFEHYARSPWLTAPGTFWWDPTAAVALTDPSLLTWEDATVTIDGQGRISRDDGGRPARIATGADPARTQGAILAGLRRGAPRPEPFSVTGTIRVTWDGSACRIEQPVAARAGIVRLEIDNRSTEGVGLLGARVVEPGTWTDVLAWLEELDLAAPDPEIPAWLEPLAAEAPGAEPGELAAAYVPLPAGTIGFLCGTGEWPDLSFADAGAIELAE